jgi:hypothetical protein
MLKVLCQINIEENFRHSEILYGSRTNSSIYHPT